jgi:hypothetical protein
MMDAVKLKNSIFTFFSFQVSKIRRTRITSITLLNAVHYTTLATPCSHEFIGLCPEDARAVEGQI